MSEAEFLEFRDWIDSREYRRSDWVIVAYFDSSGIRDNRNTFSALIPNREVDAKKILQSSKWDVRGDFGLPYFSLSEKTRIISLKLGDKDVSGDVKLESFIIFRDFRGAFPCRVEIVQNFILYHNLYYDPDRQKFVNPLTEEVVIDYVEPTQVQIRATYLKEYLAARNMMLVRFHDHLRHVDKDVVRILGKDSNELIFKDDDFHYTIYIGMSKPGQTFSRLIGKDIVRPFLEPSHEEYLYLVGKKKKRFVEFLIGINERGNRIEYTCNEEELSNNFVDKGTPHCLTPVYFRKEVLQKYYQNPRKYSVSSQRVRFLDIWEIPFGINKEDLVHVWLGDLGRIPYEEQLHWRQYNVLPSGGLNEQFYRIQILAEFAETDDPIYLLHKARRELNEKMEKKFGFRIFKELAPEDAYIEKSIHIPTTNEQKELDDQLIYLAKYLVESLDKSQLEARVSWRPSNKYEDPPTRFLGAFLIEKIGLSQTEAEQIVENFRTLWLLRSKSAAHPKSKEYRKTLQKLGMAKLTQRQMLEKLVRLLTSSLKNIADSIT